MQTPPRRRPTAAGAAALRRGAAGCQHVVDDHDALSVTERIGVHFEGVRTVFQRVLLADLDVRKFARLSDRNETRADRVSQRRTEDVAPRFDADDVVDFPIFEAVDEEVDCSAEALPILQQRSNVTEKDPGDRKVRDRSNEGFDLHEERGFEGCHHPPLDRPAPSLEIRTNGECWSRSPSRSGCTKYSPG